jgi:hypothetical protein
MGDYFDKPDGMILELLFFLNEDFVSKSRNFKKIKNYLWMLPFAITFSRKIFPQVFLIKFKFVPKALQSNCIECYSCIMYVFKTNWTSLMIK